MKAIILDWTISSNGTEEINNWLLKNPDVKIISAMSFGYGFVNQYGYTERTNYTQIFYEDIAEELKQLDQLNS